MKSSEDRFAQRMFWLSAALLVFGYGAAVGKYQVFPYRVFALAMEGLQAVRTSSAVGDKLAWYYSEVREPRPPAIRNTGGAQPGLNLVTRFAADNQIAIDVMDLDGNTVHRWNADWFTVWPDATHLSEKRIPKSRPGGHAHGAVILDDGDLVFNYDHLGLVRLDRDGGVVWRLPYQTHHSVHLHDNGNLWVCGQRVRKNRNRQIPARELPHDEYTILEVTPGGEVVHEWSVQELLQKERPGLFYMGGPDHHPLVRDDRLHLNDVEPFPSDMQEGFFKHGDVLVSMRNVNTVFVFNRDTNEIKFISTGSFVWQHDPDFIDGNTISVFDNNRKKAPDARYRQSRIVVMNAEGRADVYYEGTAQAPFYTDIMGKHQWLDNGNVLITSSKEGRAFEINPDGETVWEYYNYVDDGVIGIVEEVQRLPAKHTPLFKGSP